MGLMQEKNPTPEQLREAMSQSDELKVMWDRLWHLHPAVAQDLDAYLTDYVVHMEYGTGDFP